VPKNFNAGNVKIVVIIFVSPVTASWRSKPNIHANVVKPTNARYG
jgi:hypothetical protein